MKIPFISVPVEAVVRRINVNQIVWFEPDSDAKETQLTRITCADYMECVAELPAEKVEMLIAKAQEKAS